MKSDNQLFGCRALSKAAVYEPTERPDQLDPPSGFHLAGRSDVAEMVIGCPTTQHAHPSPS